MTEALALRLERVHSPLDVTGFRVRQLGWAGLGLGGGVVLALALPVPGLMALAFVAGGPLLAFLVVEQRLAAESERWQRRIFLELPVVAEQLGMLLGAGYSLGSALSPAGRARPGRLRAGPPPGAGRIRQGLGEVDALREWADVADVDALRRLVAVLAVNRQSGDLGRLIGEEARADPARRAPRAGRGHRAPRPAGLDPRHRGDARARRDLPGRPVRRGPAALRQLVT